MGSGHPDVPMGLRTRGTSGELDLVDVWSHKKASSTKAGEIKSKSSELAEAEADAKGKGDGAWEALGMRGYEILGPLNRGSSSTVALARAKHGGLVAVKLIPRVQAVRNGRLAREVVLQRKLGQLHPCVTALRDVRLTESHVCLVVDYANGGELFESLRQRLVRGEGPFPEAIARFLFIQVVAGVSFCHALGVCHRDLKLENILLDHPGTLPPVGHILPNTRVKLCDFGAAKSSAESRPKSFVGTTGYIAPEVLRALQMSATTEQTGMAYDGRVADLFGLGVALYVLLVGAYPFETGKNTESTSVPGTCEAWSVSTSRRIMRGDFMPVPPRFGVSDECMSVLQGLMDPDPAKRLTIKQLRDSAWFRQGVLAHSDVHGPALAVSDYICPHTVMNAVDLETPSITDLERRMAHTAPLPLNFVHLEDIPDVA